VRETRARENEFDRIALVAFDPEVHETLTACLSRRS
jgi:hypothetical protein